MFLQQDNWPLPNPVDPSYHTTGPQGSQTSVICEGEHAIWPRWHPLLYTEGTIRRYYCHIDFHLYQLLKSDMLPSDWVKYVLAHFETYNNLTCLQHGFRATHSSITQLVTTLQDLMPFRDRNTQLDVIDLDFYWAFPTVPHNPLSHKPHQYGIRGELNNWISPFLKTRYQRVVVDRAHPNWAHMDSGVTQGIIVDPSSISRPYQLPPYHHLVVVPLILWQLFTLPAHPLIVGPFNYPTRHSS